MRRYIPAGLKKIVGNSSLFWKYRHKLTGDAVWRGYASDWVAPRRSFYAEFCAEYQITSILDFGCASGNNLHRIEHDCPNMSFQMMGVDVSERALDLAKDLVESDCEFHTNLSVPSFDFWLEKIEKSKVGLAIFDRVLVVLPEEEIRQILGIIARKTGYVVIDDFYSPQKASNGVWVSKDYVSLLAEFSFDVVKIDDSLHEKTDEFQRQYGKRLVFKSIE